MSDLSALSSTINEAPRVSELRRFSGVFRPGTCGVWHGHFRDYNNCHILTVVLPYDLYERNLTTLMSQPSQEQLVELTLSAEIH
jgi:hypothetical protein